jgi:hypothetical protein
MDLPCFPPQQEGVTLLHFLKKVRANIIVPERSGPPAVSEATFSIFLATTRRLDDVI